MHPRYAAIFDIENLELNQHYCSQANDQADTLSQSTTASSLTINEQLFADIKLSAGTIIIPPPTPKSPAMKPATVAAKAKTANRLIASLIFKISIKS